MSTTLDRGSVARSSTCLAARAWRSGRHSSVVTQAHNPSARGASSVSVRGVVRASLRHHPAPGPRGQLRAIGRCPQRVSRADTGASRATPDGGVTPAAKTEAGLTADGYAVFQSRWTQLGTFMAEMTRDGDGVSALALAPFPASSRLGLSLKVAIYDAARRSTGSGRWRAEPRSAWHLVGRGQGRLAGRAGRVGFLPPSQDPGPDGQRTEGDASAEDGLE